MSSEPPKSPDTPWRLTPQRIVLLILGVVLLAIIVSTLMGGLTNYRDLRDVTKEQNAQPAAPDTAPAPVN